jgi:hypothetical protein
MREAGAQKPPGRKRSACVRHHVLTSARLASPCRSSAQPRASSSHQPAAKAKASGIGHHDSCRVSTSFAARTPM